MSKPKIPQKPIYADRLTEAKEQRRELYKELLPTLDHYQEMATKALNLQVEICKLEFASAFPDAEYRDLDLVTSINARLSPTQVEKLQEEVKRSGVKIDTIIYDSRTFTFLFFSRGNK